jgi:hypothetical protein
VSLPPRPSIRFAASLLTMMSLKAEPTAFSIEDSVSVSTPSTVACDARLMSTPRREKA